MIIFYLAHTASTYFTMAIAIDRYIAVCRPASARKFCTTKCARLIILLVLIWSFAFNATRWLEFRTVEVNVENYDVNNSEEISTTTLSPIFEMEKTELRVDPLYRKVYIFWVYLFVMFIIPFVSLSVLNFLIFLGVI